MFISKTKKSPFYQLTYDLNGKRTTVSTKTSNIQEAYKFMANYQRGSDEPKVWIDFISLSKFRDEYLEYIKTSKSKNYFLTVQNSFKRLLDFSGDINLNRIDVRLLDKFLTSTFSRTKSGASLYYRTLKAAFSKAVIWNYLSDNPFKKIKSPKVAKPFPVFISEIELKIIIELARKDYLKVLFTTAFYTGMRLGELLNMKWNWIDFKQNIITVQCSEHFTTKSKKERIIPISSTLRSQLINQLPKVIDLEKNSFVFVRISGVKLNEDFISKQFKKSVRAAELNDKIHFHTLRHSFASLLVQRGVSLYVVKELLGHESLTTTQIYAHLQQQNLRDAVNVL